LWRPGARSAPDAIRVHPHLGIQQALEGCLHATGAVRCRACERRQPTARVGRGPGRPPRRREERMENACGVSQHPDWPGGCGSRRKDGLGVASSITATLVALFRNSEPEDWVRCDRQAPPAGESARPTARVFQPTPAYPADSGRMATGSLARRRHTTRAVRQEWGCPQEGMNLEAAGGTRRRNGCQEAGRRRRSPAPRC
jgi:hypothetical protein